MSPNQQYQSTEIKLRYWFYRGNYPLASLSFHAQLMLRSFQVVNSCSRVHDRWKNVPFMSWARELVITTGELELIW